MASDVFYKWISNGGCEACDALEGIHEQPPRRPHRFCQCTILRLDPSPQPGRCVLDEPYVVDVQPGGHDADYDEETNTFTRAVWQFGFTVICRDGSVIEGTYRYDDPDVAIQFSDGEDYTRFFEILHDRVEREALDYAESECPVCSEEFPGTS